VSELGGDRIDAVDTSGMLCDVLAQPLQLGDALWRTQSAGIRSRDLPGGLVVCGMGGSAIGGDLAVAALADRLTKPMLVARGYELPSWTPPGSAVLCSSYSGNTEETLACLDAAGALGARRIVASTGGKLADSARAEGVPVIGLPGSIPVPRAAVAYTFVAAAEAAALAGMPRIHTEIDAAAAGLEGAREWLLERAAEIAAELEGTVPVIYGADLTAPVAKRWKTEVNENPKLPAFWAELPEADHNEIEGWTGAEPGVFSAVFLADADQHPRERRRIEVTAELVSADAAEVLTLTTDGRSRTERLFWALMLGDLVSLHLAALRGIDPTPIEAIEGLKRKLGSA
jgi:glucose/mannose-6-phosphate isomerase